VGVAACSRLPGVRWRAFFSSQEKKRLSRSAKRGITSDKVLYHLPSQFASSPSILLTHFQSAPMRPPCTHFIHHFVNACHRCAVNDCGIHYNSTPSSYWIAEGRVGYHSGNRVRQVSVSWEVGYHIGGGLGITVSQRQLCLPSLCVMQSGVSHQ
jgi:hypothetical protein